MSLRGNASLNWQKITSEKVIIKKITSKNYLRFVKIKDDKGSGEYAAQESVGNTLNGVHFYSFGDEDTVEYAPIVREKTKEVIKAVKNLSGIEKIE